MTGELEVLIDCLGRLNPLGIPYMVVGSMASNYWGAPRSTHDLDLVLTLGSTDIERLAAAFRPRYFIQEESIRGAFGPPHQFNAIDGQSALKVDFWMLRDDPLEQAMFARRQQVEFLGVLAWITTPEDVILHKLYWNKLTPSTRQLGDAAGVFAVQGELLDLAYLRKWAAALEVASELEGVLSGRIRPKST
jgi:hypothetical protein